MVIAVLAIYLGIIFWTARDVTTRTKNILAIGGAIILVALLNFIGLVFYLLIRPTNTLDENNSYGLLAGIDNPNLINCVSCLEVIRHEFSNCPYCGSQQNIICPDCGVRHNPTWKFCENCGHNFVKPRRQFKIITILLFPFKWLISKIKFVAMWLGRKIKSAFKWIATKFTGIFRWILKPKFRFPKLRLRLPKIKFAKPRFPRFRFPGLRLPSFSRVKTLSTVDTASIATDILLGSSNPAETNISGVGPKTKQRQSKKGKITVKSKEQRQELAAQKKQQKQALVAQKKEQKQQQKLEKRSRSTARKLDTAKTPVTFDTAAVRLNKDGTPRKGRTDAGNKRGKYKPRQ